MSADVTMLQVTELRVSTDAGRDVQRHIHELIMVTDQAHDVTDGDTQ